MPLVSRTRATFRSAEFGFLGVEVYTRVQTPRFWGQLSSAGLDVFQAGDFRPKRTSWLNVGTNLPLRDANLLRDAINEWRNLRQLRGYFRLRQAHVPFGVTEGTSGPCPGRTRKNTGGSAGTEKALLAKLFNHTRKFANDATAQIFLYVTAQMCVGCTTNLENLRGRVEITL
jgi:hypothetical protein